MKYEEALKYLMFIPIAFLLFSSALLLTNLFTKGEIIERDIELKGGKILTIETENITLLETLFPEAKPQILKGAKTLVVLEFDYNTDIHKVLQTLKEHGISGEYTVEEIGPVLGSIFWEQAIKAIIVAFILMSIVIAIAFRTLVPCVAVILAAVTDIVGALAIMNLLGIKLSLATLGALLMLIGYSVDTDVLLTTETIKTRLTFGEGLKKAMKTGLTMSFTTISVLAIMSIFSASLVIKEIATVVLIGLIIDIFSTWFTNAGILKIYVSKHVEKS